MMPAPACTAHDAHRAVILRALEAGPLTVDELARACQRSPATLAGVLEVLASRREVRVLRRWRRGRGTSWRTGYELARPSPDQRLAQARAMLVQGLTLDEAAWCLDLTGAETQTLAQEAQR